MARASPVFAIAAVLVACGTNDRVAPAPTGAACGFDALFVASDYASSGVGGFSLADANYSKFGPDLGRDPALSVSNGRAFYVARADLGLIYELDPRCGTPTGARFDANDPGSSPGAANPQDVAVSPDGSLWVPRYGQASVVQIGKSGAIARTVSLSSVAYDPDGNPNASAIAIMQVNGSAKAFVALEVLDDTVRPLPVPYANHPSRIATIDVASGAIEGTTALAGRNPFGLFVPYGGALWMAEPGDFGSTNEQLAGIERFDPQTQTLTMIAHEADFGASVAEIAVTDGCGAAIVADATAKNATSLVTFDPASGKALTDAKHPVLATSGYDLQAMLWVGDVLLVGDRTTSPSGALYAVHSFDRVDGCTLKQRVPDAIHLPQMPIAFRPTR